MTKNIYENILSTKVMTVVMETAAVILNYPKTRVKTTLLVTAITKVILAASAVNARRPAVGQGVLVAQSQTTILLWIVIQNTTISRKRKKVKLIMMTQGLNPVILGARKNVEVAEEHDVDAEVAAEKIHVIMVAAKRCDEEIQTTLIMRSLLRKRRRQCVRLTLVILWNQVVVDELRILFLIIHC